MSVSKKPSVDLRDRSVWVLSHVAFSRDVVLRLNVRWTCGTTFTSWSGNGWDAAEHPGRWAEVEADGVGAVSGSVSYPGGDFHLPGDLAKRDFAEIVRRVREDGGGK